MWQLLRCTLLVRSVLGMFLLLGGEILLAADPTVQSASYEAPAGDRAPGRVVKLSQQPAQVGDRVSQQVHFQLDMRTTIIQSGQLANENTTALRRRQQRLIEVLGVHEGRVRRARVTFPKASVQIPENPDPTKEAVQPIEGKSYLVLRHGEKLFVTDTAGAIPPWEEYELVLSSMQSLGLPNPLAEFLLTRTIRLGDRFEVPTHIAERIMALDDQMGKVHKFELELVELPTLDDRPCAVFNALISVYGSASNPLHIQIEGSLVLDQNTCRTIAVNLAGPLEMNATSASYRYQAQGKFQMALRSRYESKK